MSEPTALRLPRLQGVVLARLVLAFVACAAVAGWAASFVGLHGFGLSEMHGYTSVTAWLVPGSFDGAAFACSVLVYRASIFGRSALRGRVLMYAFTALSGWINWHYQTNVLGQWVAAALPFAAVLVFDTVLADLRAEWESRHGRQAFRLRLGLLGLRWLVDRHGTWSAFSDTLKAVPVTDLVGLGALQETHRGTAVPEPVVRSSGPVLDPVPVPPIRRYRGPVPPVTESQPVPPSPPVPTYNRPSTAAPDVRPVPPETDSERTMIMTPIGAKATDPGETRTKVQPAGTARRLISVPAFPDRSAPNAELAAAIATTGEPWSRRRVMNTFKIGTDRATKILSLVEQVS